MIPPGSRVRYKRDKWIIETIGGPAYVDGIVASREQVAAFLSNLPGADPRTTHGDNPKIVWAYWGPKRKLRFKSASLVTVLHYPTKQRNLPDWW